MKKFLVTLLAVAGLFTTFAPMGQAAELEASYIEIDALNTGCNLVGTWTVALNNTNVRERPDGPNLGSIHAGANIHMITQPNGSGGVRVGQWVWVQGVITGTQAQTNNGVWNNRVLWIATSQLQGFNSLPAHCR